MRWLSPGLALLLTAAGVASCRSTPGSAPPPPVEDAGPWLPDDPFEPVPSGVNEALELRHAQPAQALDQLARIRLWAVDAGNGRMAAIALHRSGDIHAEHGQQEQAEAAYLRALALYRSLGEVRLEAVGLNDLGLLRRVGAGDPLPPFRRAVELRRQVGDLKGLRKALLNLGASLTLGQEPGEAIPVLEEAAALAHRLEDAEGEWKAHADLAAALLLRDVREAVRRADGGLAPGDVVISPALPAWSRARQELTLAFRLARATGADPRQTACVALTSELEPLCTAVVAAEQDPVVPAAGH